VPTQHGSSALRGNVTLAAPDSSAGPWGRLDRRRLLWFILDSLEGLGKQLDDRSLQALTEYELAVRDFLEGLRERGALVGKTPEHAFVVRSLFAPGADSESRNQLRVGFALQRPGEFLLYDIDLSSDECEVCAAPALEAQQLVG
jgi:hypothetical protein